MFEKTAAQIMRTNPKFVRPDVLASVALEIMEDYNITSLLVLDNEKVVGLIHIHDLIKLGLKG